MNDKYECLEFDFKFKICFFFVFGLIFAMHVLLKLFHIRAVCKSEHYFKEII